MWALACICHCLPPPMCRWVYPALSHSAAGSTPLRRTLTSKPMCRWVYPASSHSASRPLLALQDATDHRSAILLSSAVMRMRVPHTNRKSRVGMGGVVYSATTKKAPAAMSLGWKHKTPERMHRPVYNCVFVLFLHVRCTNKTIVVQRHITHRLPTPHSRIHER